MNINFTMINTSPSGGARAIYEVINGLSKRGHKITITALQGDHSWFPVKAEVIYVKEPLLIKILNPIHKLITKKPLEYGALGDIFRRIGINIQPDIIEPLTQTIPECDINVATWFHTTFAVYRSGKGIPFYFFQDFEEIVKPLGDYYVEMFKESIYLPFNIITISLWLQEGIEDNYNKESVLCGDGIEHEVFYPRKSILKDIKEPKIMAILRGWEHKGDNDLINALNIVSKEIPDITLIAVSRKEAFDKIIKENILNFNYEFFESPSDDKLAELYSSSDLFVFPSHIEGFGLPPLEAMACGTPVVTTDCLGVRDYVENCENAIMVSPRAPQELAEGITKILSDRNLSDKFRKKGLETAKIYTWDLVADIFEKSFIDALDAKK